FYISLPAALGSYRRCLRTKNLGSILDTALKFKSIDLSLAQEMRILASIILLSTTFFSWAQPYKTIKPYKPYKWMFGVHMSVIEDDGNKLGNPFDIQNTWHYLPYPSRITVDCYINYGWSV